MEASKQFLDAGGMAVIGVVVGAGLTYVLGALNRRHQEGREDKTRWLDVRLRTYTEFAVAMAELERAKYRDVSEEEADRLHRQAVLSYRTLRLLASLKVGFSATLLFRAAIAPTPSKPFDVQGAPGDVGRNPADHFDEAVRKELGLPNYRSFVVRTEKNAKER